MAGFYLWVAGQPLQLITPFAFTPPETNPSPSRVYDNVTDRHLQMGITPTPTIETTLLSEPGQVHLLTPAVPLWLAEYAAKRVGVVKSSPKLGTVGTTWFEQWRWRIYLALQKRKATAALAVWGWQEPAPVSLARDHLPVSLAPITAATSVLPDSYRQIEPIFAAVTAILRTRRLMEEEVLSALKERGWGYAPNLRHDLHLMVLAGWVTRVSAVGVGEFGRLQCRRCGSERIKLSWCARCGTECPRCEDCRNMGLSQGCHPLYSLTQLGQRALPDTHVSRCNVQVSLPFALSPAQERAAQAVCEALQRGIPRVVIWAACGAGKTEVVYKAIQDTVNQGRRVLLVTPRRDVTAELCTRLARVMGSEYVAGVYGGGDQRYADAAILVATTHQAIRLTAVFHLVVLDECDAFPYTAEPTLQRAIARLVVGGTFIQMTATPPAHLRKPHPQREVVYIPARHHGYPLPVPQVIRDDSLATWQAALADNATNGKSSLPACLELVLCQIRRTNTQLLVFVPARRLVEPLVNSIRQAGVTRVNGVYSGSEERDAVRTAFAAGKLEVVVATTVFERGLTFPMADVAVFAADSEQVFSQSALVQMAGRVGRTIARPTGHVWFFCHRETATIKAAVNDITKLNTLAQQAGLLIRS